MRIIRCMALGLLALFGISPAYGQRPPDTAPSDRDERVVLTYDRSSSPGDQVLISPRTVIGYNRNEALGYGRLHFTCLSDSDDQFGRCPVIQTGDISYGESSVPLRFTERRSGLMAVVSIKGYLQRAEASLACNTQYWETGHRPLATSAAVDCAGIPPAGTGASLNLPAEELQKLVAGRWSATLRMMLRNAAGEQVASYTYTFDLTITDHANASIYFPLFDHVTPHVGLNIDYIPTGTPTIGGSAVLDMCLYDGLGSQSQYLEVTISDDGRPAPGRLPGMYSVWRKDGTGDEVDRLDYEIKMDYDESKITMQNTRVERLSGVDTSKLRLVVLPTMTQPVYCVPTPLELHTPRVSASSKAEGYYEGRLRIEMNMPVSSP